MATKREKLLQKINPQLLEVTPKLSTANNSLIELDSGGGSLQAGAKELMLRFFKKQENFFNSVSSENGVELSDSRYQESYRFCQSISQRLSLPFCSESDFNIGRPGKKLQDLKKELEEKMSEERKKEYQKRVTEYRKWKNEQNQEQNINDEEYFIENEVVIKATKENVKIGRDYENIHHSGSGDSDYDDDGDDEGDDVNDVVYADTNANPDKNNVENADKDGADAKEGDNIIEFTNTDCNKRDFADSLYTKGELKEPEVTKSNAKMNGTFNLVECQSPETSINAAVTNLTVPNVGDPGGKENSSDDENNLSPSPYQPSERILCSAPEQSQCTQSLPPNLLSPSLKYTLMSESQSPKSLTDSEFQENSGEHQKKLSFPFMQTKLFMESQKADDVYDLNDAFEFCSGKFPDCASGKPCLSGKLQTSVHNKKGFQFEEIENFQKHNDNLEIVHINSVKTMRRIIAFNESDDESVEDARPEEKEPEGIRIVSDDEDDFSRKSKPTKRGARQTLTFTDDEDDSSEDEASNMFVRIVGEHETDPEEENDEQRSVFYDSEENEITNPKEFFEREAELSGSEFSGDEDEKGLDEYDEEAGDADDLDYNQIQSQLGKIHLRRLFDDDSRNIRLLQELFFEDGDLHTEDSFKKFRWRNLATKLKEEQSMGGSFSERRDNQLESSDEEEGEDLQTRKERLEKALLLEKMKENGEFHFEVDFFEKLCKKLKVTNTKNQLKVEATDDDQEKKLNTENPTVGCAVIQNTPSRNFPRGSFLSRNEELLSRLAKVTAGDNVRAPKNSKNFVFVTRSPEKVKSEKPEMKRPLEELENSGIRKKPKLLSSDSSVASILDLLG